MHPIQFNTLHDIDTVELTAADDACIREIEAVLRKHHKHSKFGLALLHKHFDLENDEILVEHCRKDERVLIAKPQKPAATDTTSLIQTLWRFDGKAGKDCTRYCPTNSKTGQHYGYSDHI